jgi:predicted porin
MKVHKRTAALGVTALLACTGLASTAKADATEDLLQRLLAKGVLTQDEYDAIMKRKADDIALIPPKAPPVATDATVAMSKSGVGITMGGVEVKFSGSINGFYVHDDADAPTADNLVVGGLASVSSQDSAAIRNGLLPGFLKVDITTNQGGWDVGAHFGMYPGIESVTGVGGANSAGSPTALSTAGIDFRQTFLTFGRPGFGEVKIGRDIGLFGSEAILNDITLLSVGSSAGNAAPSNTSLGRIGVGYIYTDFQPQITYTTPNMHGFQASVGLFQPLVTAGGSEINDKPGLQAKLTYDMKSGSLAGRFWAGYVTQRHDPDGALPSYTGDGFDLGAKVTYGPATITGYYYEGEGLGTTGLFILATDAAGEKRDSDGYYLQASVTPIDKVTLAVSYGESDLHLAAGEVNPTLVEENTSWVFQGRYALTPWLNLVGEYTRTKAEAHNHNVATSDAVALGAILFF